MKDEKRKTGQANVAGEFGTAVVITPPENEPELTEETKTELVVRSIGDACVVDVKGKETELSSAEKFIAKYVKDIDQCTVVELLNSLFELVEMNQIAQKIDFIQKSDSILLLGGLELSLKKEGRLKETVVNRLSILLEKEHELLQSVVEQAKE